MTDRPYRINDSLDSSSITPRQYDEYFVEADSVEELLARIIGPIVERLPADQRDVLELLMAGVIITTDDSDQGYRRAARMLRVDHKTVKRRLGKALATVESELSELPDWTLQLLGSRLPVTRSVPPAQLGLLLEPVRIAVETLQAPA